MSLARVILTRRIMGVCWMQVCVVPDATDEEILKACNDNNPAGTEAGWVTVVRESRDGLHAPTACDVYPERLHILVGC